MKDKKHHKPKKIKGFIILKPIKIQHNGKTIATVGQHKITFYEYDYTISSKYGINPCVE